jgi:hypothetical protein
MNAGLGDQKTGRGGHDQRRDLGNQTVADGQERVVVGRLGERQLHLGDADEDAAENVDEGDQKPGDGIAADEFRGTVHRPEERAFVFQRLTAGFGLRLVDKPGGQISVDRHLLARHRVQCEAGGDFRDTAGTLGDDDEVHDHQDRENDDPDDEIAAHHQVAERLDDVAGGAAVPSWPFARISRVEAMFRPSRNMVAIRRTVGKEKNSSGFWMNRPVIRTSTEKMIDTARNMSSITGGIGRISSVRMTKIPVARPTSPLRSVSMISERSENPKRQPGRRS